MANIYDMADTWNAGGTTFSAIKMNVTDTASAAGSLLLQLQTGGVNRFTVSKAGAVTSAGAITATGSNIYSGSFLIATNGVYTASNGCVLNSSAASILTINNNALSSGGAIELIEQTAPAAPSANRVRIYAQDNGAGKTQLMALFNTGAAQQVAIEP